MMSECHFHQWTACNVKILWENASLYLGGCANSCVVRVAYWCCCPNTRGGTNDKVENTADVLHIVCKIEEIKPIALAVIKLRLSEGIRRALMKINYSAFITTIPPSISYHTIINLSHKIYMQNFVQQWTSRNFYVHVATKRYFYMYNAMHGWLTRCHDTLFRLFNWNLEGLDYN